MRHGLLGTTAQWAWPLGVTQAAPVRQAGHVLLLSASLLYLAWVGALLSQAWSGQGAWWPPFLALCLGLPWLAMVRNFWQGLATEAMLPLRWGGLTPSRATERAQELPAGWALPGWPHAVSLHVVFELGPWVLVKMVSVGPGAQPQAWSWVDARLCFQGVTGHHLRALLFSTRANEVGLEDGRPGAKPRVMASSTELQRQWSSLLSSFKTAVPNVGTSAIRRTAQAQGIAMADRDFAETVVLEFAEQAGQGRTAVNRVGCGGRS